MLVMPILVKSSKDKNINKIYNVRVKLNNEYVDKAKESTVLKGISASNILINGSILTDDLQSDRNKPSVISSFIRDRNYKQEATHFLVTTKNNPDSDTYDVYKVANMPRKVTAGLDDLYSTAVIDMMNEVPGYNIPMYLNLKSLGVDNTITENKIEVLNAIMGSNNPLERKKHLMQLNGVSSLEHTVEYMKKFDFEVINCIYEDDIKNTIDSFEEINSHNKPLEEYYKTACDNREVYRKLNRISRIIDNKSLAIIKNSNNSKVLQKRSEE